jgi:dTMP kinase
MEGMRLIVRGGYIIAIEGIDAVGKDTHSRLLSAWLKRRGVKTTLMSFPDYDTPIGREIKSFLREGETIIVNRYTESNLAYGSANGLDVDWLAGLEKGMPKANLVMVLDAPPRSLSSRRPGSSKDSYERSSALQAKAQKAYRALARKCGWKLIDADGQVGVVQAAVVAAVKGALARDRRVTL